MLINKIYYMQLLTQYMNNNAYILLKHKKYFPVDIFQNKNHNLDTIEVSGTLAKACCVDLYL